MPLYDACVIQINVMENFHGTLENYEKCESLAQQIFPHLFVIVCMCTSISYV